MGAEQEQEDIQAVATKDCSSAFLNILLGNVYARVQFCGLHREHAAPAS